VRLLRNLLLNRRSPTLPQGVRVYVVGDIHGRADLLDDLLSRIDRDLRRDSPLRAIQVFLGDYVDRGPSSKDVIDSLIGRLASHEVVCLKGNHEDCLLAFLRDPSTLEYWSQLGGLETLKSYGIRLPAGGLALTSDELASNFSAAMPESHRQFLGALRLSFTLGDFFFVHAGVRPGVPLSEQKEDDLLWIRDEFLRSGKDFGKMIIHGHTPTIEPDVRRNRIGIDTGAFATGILTCLVIENETIAILW
jgi:serine/threonine protein phosphatase 1